MNNNDAIIAQATDHCRDALADLLARAIDSLPISAFDIDPDLAQGMLDTLPDSPLRASLRDAFRDNIDTDHAFN